MNYDEFKDLCRKSWEEDYNYLYIDRSKKRDPGKYCICNESKKHIKMQHLRRNLFEKQSHSHSSKCYIQLKIEKIQKI